MPRLMFACPMVSEELKQADKISLFNIDLTSSTPREYHPGVVINRAQFDVCTPSSLGLVNKKKKSLLFTLAFFLFW